MTTAASGFIAVVVAFAAAWSLPFGSASRQETKTEMDLSQDPQLGLPLASLGLSSQDVYSKPTAVLGRGSVLLVSGGSCSGCSLHAVSFDRLPFDQFDAIGVFYQAEPEECRKMLQAEGMDKNLDERLVVLSDANRRIERTLNAIWTGRWYRFDQGRLVRWQGSAGDRSWTTETH